MKKTLSKEKQKAYIKSGGAFCPYCGSYNIEGVGLISSNDFGGSVSQTIECLEEDCGKSWEDVYTLSEIIEDK